MERDFSISPARAKPYDAVHGQIARKRKGKKVRKNLEDTAFAAWLQLAKEEGVDMPDLTAIERARWRLVGAKQVCESVFGTASEASVMATFDAINAESKRIGAMLDAL